jgi:hypothetical protein
LQRIPEWLRDSRTLTALTTIAVIGGVILRARRYFANRSLWLDEAMIALNILRRDVAGLLQPLEYNQAAPFGFLVSEQAIAGILGPGELSLRLIPFVAGIGALVMFAFVARRVLGPAPAVLAVAFLAFNEPLIYYASELKQYSTDVFWCIAILAACLPLLEPDTPRWRWWIAAIIGVVATWASHPAVFLLAGSGTVVIIAAWRAGRRREAFTMAAISAAWAAAFVAHYMLLVAEQSRHVGLQEAWSRRDSFPPASLSPIQWIQWGFMTVRDYIAYPGDIAFDGLALFAVPLGIAFVYRRGPHAGLLLAPLAFLFLACVLHRYPMRERVVVFTLPIFALLLAGGIAFLAERARSMNLAVALLAGWLLLHPTGRAARAFLHPPGREELRPMLDHVQANVRDTDGIYLFPPGAQPAFYYYVENFERYALLRERTRIIGDYGRSSAPPQTAADFAGFDRVWVIMSRLDGDGYRAISNFDSFALRIDSTVVTGAGAFLYQLPGPQRP